MTILNRKYYSDIPQQHRVLNNVKNKQEARRIHQSGKLVELKILRQTIYVEVPSIIYFAKAIITLALSTASIEGYTRLSKPPVENNCTRSRTLLNCSSGVIDLGSFPWRSAVARKH
jgi:hypothetical protein